MDQFYTVVLKFLPVILLILLGILIRAKRLVGPEAVQGIKTLIVNLSLPALLFMTFARTGFEAKYVAAAASVLLFGILALTLGTQISKVVNPSNRYYPSVFSGYETGMLGYALYTSFFGAENLFKIAVLDLGQAVFMFFVLVSWFQKQNGGQTDLKQRVSGFVKSPIILAIFAGLLLSVTGLTQLLEKLSVTSSVEDAINMLGSLTQPLICIVIGYELHIEKRGLPRQFVTVLIRMCMMAAGAFLINTFVIRGVLHLDKGFETALYTMFLLPPPFILPLYIDRKAEKETNDILNVISMHIVMTLIVFPAFISLVA